MLFFCGYVFMNVRAWIETVDGQRAYTEIDELGTERGCWKIIWIRWEKMYNNQPTSDGNY